MKKFDIEEIKAEAQKQLEKEMFDEAVEKYKEKLKNRKPFWGKLFPWKIVVIRKEDV